MMPDIGVRQLKARASELVRSVRDRRARYVLTYRGRPVAMLTPLDEARTALPSSAGESGAAAWEELDRLGKEIGQGWRSPLTGAELLSEMHRQEVACGRYIPGRCQRLPERVQPLRSRARGRPPPPGPIPEAGNPG
jgi:prevent-host-death family protein